MISLLCSKYNFVFVLFFVMVNGQVAFGKTDVSGTSTILDFYDNSDNVRGIILPAVENNTDALATDPSVNNGTFLFDKSDKKLKMYEDGQWVSLSDEGSLTRTVNNSSEESDKDQGVIIGANTSSARGVLVLESSDKAIILPKIADPHISVKSPYAGMICYDTESKTIAIFDGANWNFWK